MESVDKLLLADDVQPRVALDVRIGTNATGVIAKSISRSQSPPAIAVVLAVLLSVFPFGAKAQCYDYFVDNQKPKSSTPEGACAAAINQVETMMCAYGTSFKFYYSVTGVSKSQPAPHQGWCSFKRHAETVDCVGASGHAQSMPGDVDLSAQYAHSPNCGQQYYVESVAPQEAECGAICDFVADPINPANGGMYLDENDVPRSIRFNRFYNSKDTGSTALSAGWRHAYSRRVDANYQVATYKAYTAGNSNASSLFSDPGPACTAGFTEIKGRVPAWQSAISTYSNGICKLTVGSSVIATLPIFSSSTQLPAPNSTPIEFRVTRDDGKRVRFRIEAGAIVAPPATKLKLQQTSGGFVLTNEQDEIETYDSTGKLLSITSRNSQVHSMGYDSSGRMNLITDTFGHSLSLSYGSQSRLASLTDAAGQFTQYSYDGQGRLSSVTLTDGTTRAYLYEDQNFPNAVTGLKDESTSRYSTWSYDASGRAIETHEANGVDAMSLVYNADGSVTTTDVLGAVRTFTFKRLGDLNLVSSISGSQCPTCTEGAATTYDLAGFVTSRTDYRGIVTAYVHNTRGLETSRTEAQGTPRARTITTQWHATYRLPTSIDEPGRRTTFTYDSAGNMLTQTTLDTATSVSRVWTYTYDSYGRVLTADGPRTTPDITTYTYYNCTSGYHCGQVNTTTNALGHVTTYNTYNAHGKPLTMTDPNGVVTTLTYDLRQRLTSITVGTELTSMVYWPTGLLKRTTLPDGSYLEYTYDAAHRLVGIKDGDSNHIAYTLDAAGNRIKDEIYDPSNALSRTRSRTFNSLSWLTAEIGAAGTPQVTTSFGYDANGNQTSIIAPMGRSTGQSYDELNRLITETDAATGVTTYGYNALDQLISVTDPRGLTTTYTRNAFGEVTQQVSPDTGTTTNTYGTGGLLMTSTDARGVVTTYSYDALNRVKTVAFTLGGTTDQTITYNYDAGTYGKGRLTSVSDSSHSMSWIYDALGRVTSKSQTIGGVTKTMGYGYTNGQLTTLTTPLGLAYTYGYTNNRITSIRLGAYSTNILTDVLYEPFGQPRLWTWGNGTLAARTYDQDGKVIQVDSGGLKTYSYDDAFRITGVTDPTNAANSWTYGYDTLDRLTSAAKPSQSSGWSYDVNGNRLTQSGPTTQSITYSPTSNRAGTISGSATGAYSYDAAGNIVGDAIRSFTYNNRGRMKTSTYTGGPTTTYTYNALGQRIRKLGSRVFVYDEDGHLIGEYAPNGALIQETIWMGDIPVAVTVPGAGGYIHTDHLNTPRKITSIPGNGVLWKWDSGAFGDGAPNQNPQGLGVFNYNPRFPGQYFDSETGLHYNYFREYDPYTGRYFQSDPIGLNGGINTYAYVSGDPISGSDPLGLVGPHRTSLQNTINVAVARRDYAMLETMLEAANPAQAQLIRSALSNRLSQELSKDVLKKMASQSETIAKSSRIDKVEELCEKFGGKSRDWTKKKGFDDKGNEWHWYENLGKKVGRKRAGEPDPF